MVPEFQCNSVDIFQMWASLELLSRCRNRCNPYCVVRFLAFEQGRWFAAKFGVLPTFVRRRNPTLAANHARFQRKLTFQFRINAHRIYPLEISFFL